MIDGQLHETISYEPPSKYTPTNIIYWESTSKELRMQGRFGIALLNKARKFLVNQCIEQIDFTSWACKPIKDYNKKTYKISSKDENFTCECQGFRKKKKEYDEGDSSILPICSHILALKQFCFIEEKNYHNDKLHN